MFKCALPWRRKQWRTITDKIIKNKYRKYICKWIKKFRKNECGNKKSGNKFINVKLHTFFLISTFIYLLSVLAGTVLHTEPFTSALIPDQNVFIQEMITGLLTPKMPPEFTSSSCYKSCKIKNIYMCLYRFSPFNVKWFLLLILIVLGTVCLFS